MNHDNGNKHKLEGAWDKVKGEAKDSLGKMTDDRSMQAEGKWDKAKGDAKQLYGDVKNEFNHRD